MDSELYYTNPFKIISFFSTMRYSENIDFDCSETFYGDILSNDEIIVFTKIKI